jgi:hypothetical protein
MFDRKFIQSIKKRFSRKNTCIEQHNRIQKQLSV